MKLGVDLSIQEELDSLNPKYIYKGEEIEPFSFFSTHSKIETVRLRLWHNPYSLDNKAYGGGVNDLKTTLKLAKRANENNMDVLLDFHYSDFFVDPSRQKLPKAWENMSFKEVINALYIYTKETLKIFKNNNINISSVQIGNEISNGMLFPYGNVWKEYSEECGGGFKGLALLLKQGIKAVKEIYPSTKTIIHLEHAGSNDMQEYFFSHLLLEGVDFDIIGESYYPYWHGGFPCFIDNINKLKEKYHKEIYIVEMGYEYSESRVPNHHFENKDLEGDEFKVGNLAGRVPFPITKKGQMDYLKYFLKLCKELGIEKVFYWEPTWIELPNNGWAKDDGQIYCGLSPSKAYNDWANETLFDFDGNANPGVEIFSQDYIDSIE